LNKRSFGKKPVKKKKKKTSKKEPIGRRSWTN